MTSRLDRLFVLLEAGSGAATRRAAARQLGEVQRAHPEELHRLLARLMRHLRAPAWETRVAATQAVEEILSNVPEWHPPADVKDEDNETEESGRLRCETFDIERLLQNGAQLMGSEGNEYDMEDVELSATDISERMAKQRQQLNAKLGLDVASTLGIDLSNVYTNEDLCPTTPVKNEVAKRPIQELVLQQTRPLSSREMNLARRRARASFGKQKSRECDDAPPTPPVEPERKKFKMEGNEDYVVDSGLAVPERGGGWAGARRWPLEAWCGALQAQLFSAAWEARHGAAGALRELLRAPVAASADHRAGMTPQQMEDAHQEWLEDMALRLLCVLALDRFGDFVSDQVVAPVRETCAQTLGVALARLRAPRVRLVAERLATLARQPQWEARHGALLAFKYLLAARQEVAIECGVLEHLMAGLEDVAEDVSGVAAGALAPAAAALAASRPLELPRLASALWQLLRATDDLAAPATHYMALLASLMALPAAAQLLKPIDLADVLPRLWPYLDHSASSVRKATLQTLRTLTKPLVTIQNGDSSKPTENGNSEHLDWTPELLQEAMRYIYQRILFEHVHEIQEIGLQVWKNLVRYASLGSILLAACPMLSLWLCLAMQPARAPVDPALLLQPPLKERRTRTSSMDGEEEGEARGAQKWYVGGSESQPAPVRDRNVTRARCLAADMLGYLSCYLVQPAPGIDYKAEDESPIDCYVRVMVVYVRSGSALQRLVAALVLASWARRTRELRLYPPPIPPPVPPSSDVQPYIQNAQASDKQAAQAHGEATADTQSTVTNNGDVERDLAPPLLRTTLLAALTQALYYDEVALNCNRILQEARDLLAMMKHYKLPVEDEGFNNIMRLEQVVHMTTMTQPMVAAMKLKRVAQTLEERRKTLQTSVNQCSSEQTTLNISVQAALAGACAALRLVPERLNPLVRPLMDGIKREAARELQETAARALADLAPQLLSRDPCPNHKILANLKAFLRCDPDFTPRITLESSEEANGDSGSGESGAEGKEESSHGAKLDMYNGILTLREQQRSVDRTLPRRGRPPTASVDLSMEELFPQEDEAQKLLRIQRRGATMALNCLTAHFGDELPEKLPKLWEFIIQPFEKVMSDAELEAVSVEVAEETVSRLQVLEAVAGNIGSGLWPRLLAALPAALRLTRAPHTATRHMAARALAALAAREPQKVLPVLLPELIEALTELSSERVRCGAAETLARIVDTLRLQVVPYIVLLVVPLLGRMSDHNEAVRTMSTRCFATLIQLMPLDGAIPEPEGLSQEMRERKARDKDFLEQLFNPKSIKDYKIPIPVSAELRSYQQAGVNWLRFLHDYKLHGVLCDDMGLGKTLQSVIMVAGSHYERDRDQLPPLPSLVVCPPSLTGHWVFEVNKFIPKKFLKPLQYVGTPAERERLRSHVQFYNLIVASYDIVRKDIDFFSSFKWNYCILDEGHVIKNGKTKAFKAIKQIVAHHRLILSGTPIQNNVVELWSLFDFLLPGLLGSERQFSARYSRPILAARDPRAAPAQLQAGARACEALHRQVLPFLLRRVKEDVLRELPPKITQDYYCELSPLQRSLYELFSKEHLPDDIENSHTHVFQALHYLQNVCNHPKLVLTPEHPEAARVARQLASSGSTLDDIDHAAKLPALKQLLLECGIGRGGCVASAHRALVFCQLKAMLDIVEKDLLKTHLPTVTYLRLDGSVPPPRRHAIVTRFNTDVSIDLLLLTTAVGGLGLNLTGADTVIFVEHDWNPMRDLQAMDRAHRIGQKRVVNVYRLIARDTIEEKIMGLQKFKLMTANAVISSENAALETMGTHNLLDLFQMSGPSSGPSQPSGSKSVLETLPDLWDDKDYEEEYDMTNFIKSLNKIKQ
ncbi:TATA-binding protein-associated factor 172 [Aricia agestis]|uniref:TATA-binding protein-associated factor 172 n=1 Tax=Aricia agestis TaxID=91739 RepID=UPI001C2071A1|nr:TATA-binding protein-associated factor 172 [Aricia agestis]